MKNYCLGLTQKLRVETCQYPGDVTSNHTKQTITYDILFLDLSDRYYTMNIHLSEEDNLRSTFTKLEEKHQQEKCEGGN